MRVVFFGTPPFAAHILKFLLDEKVDIVAVVSRPDKPQGRSRQLQPTAVKQLIQAQRPDIPLYQPTRASSEEFVQTLQALEPDLFIVVAYGEILRQKVLDIPRLMPINVHASLLPKYRGAAPIQRTLMAGETKGGVTIMEMVLEMDAGDSLHVEEMDIPLTMTLSEYSDRLCELSCRALKKVLADFDTGKVKKIPQPKEGVTFAPKISQVDCEIDWSKKSFDIHNQVRGLSPRPGAYALIKEADGIKRLKIIKTIPSQEGEGSPKKVIAFSRHFIVGCGKGSLEILEVQPEGKRVMTAQDYMRGFPEPHFI